MTTARTVPPAPPTVPPRSGTRRNALDRRRRGLTYLLGLIWLLDAALQYQPYMFTKAFPNELIVPVGEGSPTWVAGADRWTGHLLAHHIVVLNALFATVQLLLALGLFWRRTTRLALAASIVWAVLVWWLGEGLGAILAGPVSALMGLPGAVIVYALIALAVWPPRESGESGESSDGAAAATADDDAVSVAETGLWGSTGARGVWVLFWAFFVVETLRPANRSHAALGGMVAGMGSGEPGWLAHLNTWAARDLLGNGAAVTLVLTLVFAALAVSVLVPFDRRPVLIVGIVAALAIWVVAEDLGGILTGQGTDPNSGLLLAVFALCFWPVRGVRPSPAPR